MTIDQSENKNYDVQYSIRLPQDLLDEIGKRAELEGVKPSTWIRNNLVKLIQDKDEGVAGSIKPALMYLLTSDSDVQKQIQKVASNVRAKGETSRVESALTEYTALNEQSEILENNIKRLTVDAEDLTSKQRDLRVEYNTLVKKLEVLKSTFDKDDDRGKLRFVLAEYEDRVLQKRQDIDKFSILLEKKRSEVLNYKMLLSDVNVRKKQILTQYCIELGNNCGGVKESKDGSGVGVNHRITKLSLGSASSNPRSHE